MKGNKKQQQWFDEHLHSLPDQFLACRDMRHAWEIQVGYKAVGQVGEGRRVNFLSRTLKCLRCGTERRDVLNARTFDRVSTAYSYPESYQIRGNKVRNAGRSVRREVYERSFRA